MQELLDARGMTPNRLSIVAGLNKDTVGGLLAGKRPHRRTIEKIARTLGVSVDFLTGSTSQPVAADTVAAWSATDEESHHIRAAMKVILEGNQSLAGYIATAACPAVAIRAGDRLIIDTRAATADGALMLVSLPTGGRTIRYRVRPYWIGENSTGPMHDLDTAETQPIGRIVGIFRTP